MENLHDISVLFDKLLLNQCSPEEVDRLMQYISSRKQGQQVVDCIQEELGRTIPSNHPDEATRMKLERILSDILSSETNSELKPRKGRIIEWNRIKIAVSIAATLVISVLAYWQWDRFTSSPKTTIALQKDVSPGGNKAILTLADGSQIILDDTKDGNVAQQGHTEIMKRDHQVVYDASNSTSDTENRTPTYNTLTAPRGGEYRLTLPDGTKVWLNAASSIKFPTIFFGTERKVEITGEVYFEVQHLSLKSSKTTGSDKSTPFIVAVNGAEVKVLGTHFNVNAYNDESTMKVTLLEGSVQVSSLLSTNTSSRHSSILSPGQQASLDGKGILNVKEVDATEAVAWKEGFFRFDNADMGTIIRQLSRWYDVDINSESKLADKHVSGYISRKVNISKVLEMLEYTAGIKYKIEGRKIIINR